MSRNKFAALAAVFGGMALLGAQDGFSRGNSREYDPAYEPTPKKPVPPGCKEYTRHGITVVAISHKSAMKKIGKILERQRNENKEDF